MIEIFDWKLSFALIALSVGIMSETADMHDLIATFLGTNSCLIIKVKDLPADTTRLQLRPVSVSLFIVNLSEEVYISIIKVFRTNRHIHKVRE